MQIINIQLHSFSLRCFTGSACNQCSDQAWFIGTEPVSNEFLGTFKKSELAEFFKDPFKDTSWNDSADPLHKALTADSKGG